MLTGITNLPLFFLNCFVLFSKGAITIVLIGKIKETMNSKKNMTNIFKITSFFEGVSYVLLLFVGVPLKYFGDNPILVKSLGMPHGMLFLAYIVMALLIREKMKWDVKSTLGVLVASILPFGTFYINKKYFGTAI
jgi:integral membrane protein